VWRAMMTRPKFLSPDVPLFLGILQDLFPSVQLPPPDYTHLTDAMVVTATELQLEPTPVFLAKVRCGWARLVVGL
jgi:dynein heavy chain